MPEAGDTQPNEFVTVNVKVPCGRPEIVVLEPEPVVFTAPGDLIIVQLPVIGSPFITTLPVGTAHVGCVTVPIIGVEGLGDWEFIVTEVEGSEVQPAELETVKVYAPAESPEIVVLIPVPVVVTPPGNRVNVQVPLEGNPFRTTLPVDNPQVG